MSTPVPFQLGVLETHVCNVLRVLTNSIHRYLSTLRHSQLRFVIDFQNGDCLISSKYFRIKSLSDYVLFRVTSFVPDCMIDESHYFWDDSLFFSRPLLFGFGAYVYSIRLLFEALGGDKMEFSSLTDLWLSFYPLRDVYATCLN